MPLQDYFTPAIKTAAKTARYKIVTGSIADLLSGLCRLPRLVRPIRTALALARTDMCCTNTGGPVWLGSIGHSVRTGVTTRPGGRVLVEASILQPTGVGIE